MKRILIVALAIFAVGLSGCAVSTGTDGILGDMAVEVPEEDVSNPFMIEPADEADGDIEDDVVVEEDEGDDDGAVEEGEPAEVKLFTDEDDIDPTAEPGEFYSQVFRVVDYGAEYKWSVTGLPNNSGLALVEIYSNASTVELKGTIDSEAAGTHQITVTVWDAADPSNKDSISFELEFKSNVNPYLMEMQYDPCDMPLTIEVVKVGNYIDHDILQAGEFTFEIGSKVGIEVRARRGNLAPKGNVSWEFKSEVKNSKHCRFLDDQFPYQTGYDYDWVSDGQCTGPSSLPVPAVDSDNLQVRKTTNPFWKIKDAGASKGVSGGSANSTLELEGTILYDGPLRVRYLPLDRNAIERLTITARDECEYSEKAKSSMAVKNFKFGIAYPDKVGSDGGAMTDMKAYLDYNLVGQYNDTEHSCSGVEDKYRPACQPLWKLAVIFTDSDGLSEYALNKLKGPYSDFIPALKESVGWVHYGFKECDDDHDNCDEKVIESGDSAGSVLEAAKVYLVWDAAPIVRIEGTWAHAVTHYPDFDIKKITFKNRYWYARFRDSDDKFNRDITTNWTWTEIDGEWQRVELPPDRASIIMVEDGIRLDMLWHFDGMTERSYRYSDDSDNRVVFHRQEMAAYEPYAQYDD